MLPFYCHSILLSHSKSHAYSNWQLNNASAHGRSSNTAKAKVKLPVKFFYFSAALFVLSHVILCEFLKRCGTMLVSPLWPYHGVHPSKNAASGCAWRAQRTRIQCNPRVTRVCVAWIKNGRFVHVGIFKPPVLYWWYNYHYQITLGLDNCGSG